MPKTIVLLHEWQENAEESKKPVPQIDYQAEYVVKLSEKKEQEERQKAAKGEPAPESLITWIFQDDFIPRARITKDGIYSIMTDYLGTLVEAYDESGTLSYDLCEMVPMEDMLEMARVCEEVRKELYE